MPHLYGIEVSINTTLLTSSPKQKDAFRSMLLIPKQRPTMQPQESTRNL